MEKFEGPLGLLLHLIRSQEMNIFDIDISRITQQYLDYIKAMKNLNLELAGDFVAMAATLLQIKSRMLLPQHEGDSDEVVTEDPRRELVQKLLEYQKFQDAAKYLGERKWMGRDVWARGERFDWQALSQEALVVDDNPLFSLITAYRMVIRSMKSGVHRVVEALESIASRIESIKEKFVVGQQLQFQELLSAQGAQRTNQTLITFLSLLELAKMGFIYLFQTENFEEIRIETRKPIDRNVVASHVEDYASKVDNSSPEVVSTLSVEVSRDQIPLDFNSKTIQTEELVGAEMATDAEIEAEEKRLFEQENGMESTSEQVIQEPSL
ncbi:MAG: segregation/condensation protein A [Bdellovibrionales bacterium]|nr:segregation/condensation protein A [Bdellovibrionales bacterium]